MNNTLTQKHVDETLQAALAALNEKRPFQANEAFTKLIGYGVVNASIWLGKAYACRDLNDHSAMQDAIDQSLALEARNPRAFLLRANHFESVGDTKAAASFYAKAIAVAPTAAKTPRDLQEQLAQAQNSLLAMKQGFEKHLTDFMKSKMAASGISSGRFAESIDLMTGKKQAFSPQPKNYYLPGLPAIQFFNREDFDWVPALEASTSVIREELQQHIQESDGFSPYVTGGADRPLSDPHGMKNNDGWAAYYLWQNGELVAKNAKKFPKTAAILQEIPYTKIAERSPNILFSRLKAGANIPPHHGLTNSRLICHLPLIVPINCGFRVGNDTRNWQEGQVFIFDDTIEHEAWNRSTDDRYILIFEIWRPELSDEEQGLVASLFEAIDSYNQP
ncbi:MAG: aspartyl/asparaginyl beta-hydroxylase domain-containing protein [Kordiimonadaceae bacterium]|nr:aspartyl/asparaginyl beta-hydroxylase domain-containing protein [Kordiimonadaceae bacterium]